MSAKGQKRTIGRCDGMSDKGHKRTTALVFGLERNGCCGGAMTTTFAGESVPRPAQKIHQNDGDISAVASERSRCLARAVRYINSPKRRRNCSSKRSSIVSALSRTIALNSSLNEAHSLGLVSRGV